MISRLSHQVLFVALALVGAVSLADEPKESSSKKETKERALFDGRTLDDWTITNFGGEGEVYVEDGQLFLSSGSPMTGVTYKGKDLPKTNYELSLEAMRVSGSDFFCGLTFPVAESHCSLILGGWGGGVMGISSIDGLDASENETTKYQEFKNGQWHKVKVRVTPERLIAWLDGKIIAEVELKDKKISTRIEVDRSKPLGLATYDTKGAIKNFKLLRLEEKKAEEK